VTDLGSAYQRGLVSPDRANVEMLANLPARALAAVARSAGPVDGSAARVAAA
jgi:hypothetical protein